MKLTKKQLVLMILLLTKRISKLYSDKLLKLMYDKSLTKLNKVLYSIKKESVYLFIPQSFKDNPNTECIVELNLLLGAALLLYKRLINFKAYDLNSK